MSNTTQNDSLIVTTESTVKQELIQDNLLTQTEQQDIEKNANFFVEQLMASDFNEIKQKQSSINQMENIGADIQLESSKKMELLKQPIETLSRRAEDGGEVANALMDLKLTIESLDPSQIDFDPGWFSRLLGHLPWIGTPIKRYLTKFESAQTVLASVIRSLEMGKEQLIRDNTTLKEDQKELWNSEKKLEQVIVYASEVDKKLEEKRLTLDQGSEEVKFIEEYLQFPVKQRIIDLQQQLIVQQQTLVASEIIVRNNKELVRGVDRALNVTVRALQNATTIAMALAHQEKVLQKVDKVNKTTSKLITDTARRLKTQGTTIHKEAASAQIDIQALKSALSDIRIALDEIATFRKKALPGMTHVVNDLDKLIKENAEPLSKIERQ